MIETRIDKMLSLARAGKILSESAFSGVSPTDALQLRELDSQYRNYNDNQISDRWRILPIHPDIRGAFEELRDLTYSIAMGRIQQLTNADDDTTHLVLSSHITQEIEYIAMCRGTQYYTEWYDQLWACYLRDEIPMITAGQFVKPLINAKNAG